jgi:ABC-type Fe3+/spermidine/putrescine transport system ATPase subunit
VLSPSATRSIRSWRPRRSDPPAAVAGGLFQIEAVSASRDGRLILDHLDLDIERGVTAIVGPSGSGKSTLLRLLNRLADPDSGTIRFDGDDVRSLDPLALRRRACLVPQLPALLPGTAADNVRYGPALCGDEADVTRSLELAGLSGGYAERDADRLSVGEQQRVMLARALALEPETLLLDEPTSALDDRAKEEVEATLTGLVEKLGVSAVIVTHDRAQAERLASRTVELGAR